MSLHWADEQLEDPALTHIYAIFALDVELIKN